MSDSHLIELLCYSVANCVAVGNHVALNIRSKETEELVAELARLTGESKTDAVTKAVRDRLERVKRTRRKRSLADELDAIARQCAALPVLDARSADDILGYDDHGLPG
jgi:antitoxin VapB